jgi:hypothetical protein
MRGAYRIMLWINPLGLPVALTVVNGRVRSHIGSYSANSRSLQVLYQVREAITVV